MGAATHLPQLHRSKDVPTCNASITTTLHEHPTPSCDRQTYLSRKIDDSSNWVFFPRSRFDNLICKMCKSIIQSRAGNHIHWEVRVEVHILAVAPYNDQESTSLQCHNTLTITYWFRSNPISVHSLTNSTGSPRALSLTIPQPDTCR